MALQSIVLSPNAKAAALSFVLSGRLNKIIWDDCQFIWDSRGMIDAASDDQVAIFGVQGKVITPDNKLLQFQIRHCLDFDPQPKYRLYAALVERSSGLPSEVDIRDDDIAPEEDEVYFRRQVLDLTAQASSIGLGRAMWLFLTRPGDCKPNLYQKPVSNGI